MPAGVNWGEYLRFTAVAMLTMFAGAQVVHNIYRPLDKKSYMKEHEANNSNVKDS